MALPAGARAPAARTYGGRMRARHSRCDHGTTWFHGPPGRPIDSTRIMTVFDVIVAHGHFAHGGDPQSTAEA